jgi:hypothetical protein
MNLLQRLVHNVSNGAHQLGGEVSGIGRDIGNAVTGHPMQRSVDMSSVQEGPTGTAGGALPPAMVDGPNGRQPYQGGGVAYSPVNMLLGTPQGSGVAPQYRTSGAQGLQNQQNMHYSIQDPTMQGSDANQLYNQDAWEDSGLAGIDMQADPRVRTPQRQPSSMLQLLSLLGNNHRGY